jgi:Lambda phage tail tube protein, TTP
MPSNAVNAQGTVLQISGTGGAAKTITAIALGFPTILTSAAHGLVNGDVVAMANFTGADAALINGLSFVISNVTTNTFAIGLNSTGKTITVGTGTATPQTWTTIGDVVSGSGFDGTSAVIDKTNLASVAKEKGVGLQDFGSLRLEVNVYDDDAGQAALKSAKAGQTRKSFKVTYPDNSTRTFYGYVMAFPEKFGVDSNITGSIDILIDGDVTYA